MTRLEGDICRRFITNSEWKRKWSSAGNWRNCWRFAFLFLLSIHYSPSGLLTWECGCFVARRWNGTMNWWCDDNWISGVIMDGGSIYYSGSIPTCACLGMSAMRLIGQKRCSLKKRLKGDGQPQRHRNQENNKILIGRIYWTSGWIE